MMSHHEPFDPLEGMSLFIVFSPKRWDLADLYEPAILGRNPDARDERVIAEELACGPTEQDEEEQAEDGQPQGEENLEPANWQMKLLDARPGKPFVYDEEVKRAKKCRQLEQIVLEAIGSEYETNPEYGLVLLDRQVRESGFHEIVRARDYVRRFSDLSAKEFEKLRMELVAFSRRRVKDVDTREPLRLALACRNAPKPPPLDTTGLSFSELMEEGWDVDPAAEKLRALEALVELVHQLAAPLAESFYHARDAWKEIQRI